MTDRPIEPSYQAGVTLRAAVEDDAREIAGLFLISSDGLAAYIWERDRASGVSLIEHGTARYARRSTLFSFENCTLAMMGGEVVAMLHAFEMPADDSVEEDPVLRPYSELEDAGSFYISGLAVKEARRGRGIGGLLLGQAEAKARDQGLTRLSLICFERNEGACALYLRRGYRIIDRRPLVPHPTLHYADGDALLMALEL